MAWRSRGSIKSSCRDIEMMTCDPKTVKFECEQVVFQHSLSKQALEPTILLLELLETLSFG